MSTYETLIVERRGHVAWLRFNRPEVLNAFNNKMAAELRSAWQELDADDSVRVIVNTGNGRAFQTGVDVREVADSGGMGGRVAKAEKVPEGEKKGGMTARHNDVLKPVIAAVNGVCAGAGFHFVVDADLVVCSRTAYFTDPHVSVGQVSAQEPIGLIGRIPLESILRLVLMGRHERWTAERAFQLGLVGEIFEPETFEDQVQALAEKMATNSPSTMMYSKRAIWEALDHGRTEALEIGTRLVFEFFDHPDNVEGAKAFSEKRAAEWAPPRRPKA